MKTGSSQSNYLAIFTKLKENLLENFLTLVEKVSGQVAHSTRGTITPQDIRQLYAQLRSQNMTFK